VRVRAQTGAAQAAATASLPELAWPLRAPALLPLRALLLLLLLLLLMMMMMMMMMMSLGPHPRQSE
jgi:hypothetical protein